MRNSYNEEAHNYKDYEIDNFYYKFTSFNKSPPNYHWNLAGVQDDHVIRVESYLKNSFSTLGLSFNKKNGQDTIKLSVQQEFLHNGINGSVKHPRLTPFAEKYSTADLPHDEMVKQIKKFNLEYLQQNGDKPLNHQQFISILTQSLNIQIIPISNPKTGLKKHIANNGKSFHSLKSKSP